MESILGAFLFVCCGVVVFLVVYWNFLSDWGRETDWVLEWNCQGVEGYRALVR